MISYSCFVFIIIKMTIDSTLCIMSGIFMIIIIIIIILCRVTLFKFTFTKKDYGSPLNTICVTMCKHHYQTTHALIINTVPILYCLS